MRGLVVFAVCLGLLAPALAQQDKKTNDLKPADPDTGESTVEETTLGLLPNPLEKQGIKFALDLYRRGSRQSNRRREAERDL